MPSEPHAGIGAAVVAVRLGAKAVWWTLRKAGFVRYPYLGNPVAAHGNLPGEHHVLWQVPVMFRRWELADARVDFAVYLRWQFGPLEPFQMVFAGNREPERLAALRATDPRVVPIVIRSEVGERVRLSTQPHIAPVEVPKDAARLIDLGVFWNMASERIDFPPGKHWLTVELRIGRERVSSAGYRLEVPRSGEDNSRFLLVRVDEARHAAT